MDFLTNPWFVGIIGGVISGIIVFFITGFIVNKVNRKDYYKSVDEINLKVSKMLIMSISENKIPSPPVIDSLLSSLAKRHKIQKKDVNNVEETYNDLITELFETNFIPIDKKQSLAESLIDIKNSLSTIEDIPTVSENIATDSQDRNLDSDFAFKRLRIKLISYTLSLGIVIPIYFLLVYITLKDSFIFSILFDSENFPMIMGIMAATFSFVISVLTLFNVKKKSSNTRKTEESN